MKKIKNFVLKVNPNILLVIVPLFLCFVLFRGLFHGNIWIGNPDRLNSDLKVLHHYISQESNFQISAWDENEMMGYDSFALPYTFPTPLIYVFHFLKKKNLIKIMSFFEIAQLFALGLSMFFLLKNMVSERFAILVGVITYQFSSLAILKLSQNSLTFVLLVMMPIGFLFIRQINRENAIKQFIKLAVLLSIMMECTFLQEAAYVWIFLFLYSIFISNKANKFLPFKILILAGTIGLIFAIPRVYGIFTVLKQYSREIPGLDFSNFDTIFEFQNIRWYEIFRWFDADIFGQYPSEAVSHSNNINLTEGCILFTAGVVPFFLIFEALKQLIIRHVGVIQLTEFFFLVATVFLSVGVIEFKIFSYYAHKLFFNMDFVHARIIMLALFANSVLLTLFLSQIASIIQKGKLPDKQSFVLKYSPIVLALFAYWLMENIVNYYSGWNQYQDFPLLVNNSSLLRIYICFGIWVVVTLGIYFSKYKLFAYRFLSVFIIVQCFFYADRFINGIQNFDFDTPFFKGNMYYAKDFEFKLPSAKQIESMNQRIDSNQFRTVLICDKSLADGFCAGHVSEYWGLRTVDGYYGIGVPYRLRLLPWKNQEVSLRTISFTNMDEIPWHLLGFLNVRSALISDNKIFRNIDSDSKAGSTTSLDFKLLLSPERVTPRAFFTQDVKRVETPEQAKKLIFKDGNIADPTKISFVEGMMKNDHSFLMDNEKVVITGHGSHLIVNFKPANGARFLVLNELYFPGWRAFAGSRELDVYPTNIVMRGVVVPKNISQIHFKYQSVVELNFAKMLRALIMVGLVVLIFFRNKIKESV
jgi:hypothetical protein